jgi:hypothetical protein
MEQETQHPGSHLFTVRVWQEELGGGQAEWRGRAQDIATGEAAYFRDWSGLIAVLSRLLEAKGAAPAGAVEPSSMEREGLPPPQDGKPW